MAGRLSVNAKVTVSDLTLFMEVDSERERSALDPIPNHGSWLTSDFS